MDFTPQFLKISCEYRFRPCFQFFDLKNKMGAELISSYKHWKTKEDWARLNNFENRSAVLIAHDRLAFEIDVPDSSKIAEENFEAAINVYTKNIAIKYFHRIGVRIQALIPVEFTFEELVGLTKDKFLNQDKKLTEIVGDDTKDYMYNIVSKKSDHTLQVICGPVASKELPRWFQEAEMQVSEGEHLKEIKLPDTALFIDADCYTLNPNTSEAKPFLKRGFDIASSIPNEIGNYIFGD